MQVELRTRVSFVELTARLRAHPCEIAIALAELGVEPRDWYPSVEMSWLEALRAMYPHHFVQAEPVVQDVKSLTCGAPQNGVASEWGVDVRKIVSALAGRSMWGKHTLPESALGRICHGLSNPDRTVRELELAGILLRQPKTRSVSLNPAAKDRIETIRAKQLR